MKVPTCCGKEMKVDIETSTVIELRCHDCGDIIYIKKYSSKLPQLLDD